MSKFKVGDLAIIKFGEDAGAQVVLVSFHLLPSGEFADTRSGYFKASGNPQWFVDSANESTHGLFDESWLMPLRGDFQPEQQKAKEVAV